MDPQVEKVATEAVLTKVEKNVKKEKPLKPARSEAELLALKQRKIQIFFSGTNALVACLTCLKVFDII